jgi:hypothetical protein
MLAVCADRADDRVRRTKDKKLSLSNIGPASRHRKSCLDNLKQTKVKVIIRNIAQIGGYGHVGQEQRQENLVQSTSLCTFVPFVVKVFLSPTLLTTKGTKVHKG